jgi:hypothetical protein
MAFTPQANYTDLSAKFSATFADRKGIAWSARRVPTFVYLGFSRPESLLFIEVAPQLSSLCSVDSVPGSLLLRKSDSAGNRIRDLWICSQDVWPLDHRGDEVQHKFQKQS